MPDSKLVSLLAAETILKDLELRGLFTEDELAELWAALAERWAQIKSPLDADVVEQEIAGRSLLLELAGSAKNPDALSKKFEEWATSTPSKKELFAGRIKERADGAAPSTNDASPKTEHLSQASPEENGSSSARPSPPTGLYVQLLGHRHASLVATVVLFCALLGAGAGIVWLWRMFSTDGRFVMLSVPALGCFVAARLGKNYVHRGYRDVLDVSGILLGCATFSATYFLSISSSLLVTALMLFAGFVAVSFRSMLTGPWFAAALTTWWFAVAQVWLSQLAPSQSHWVITAGAGLLTLAAWRPWLAIPLRQDRVHEVGLTLITAGGAMLLLGLQVLYRWPIGLSEYDLSLLGPAAILSSAAFLSLAWSDLADSFTVSRETVRLVARLIALLLCGVGVVLSLGDARALTVSAGMLCFVGPIVWKARVRRRWPVLLSASAFVVLVCGAWYQLSTGQSNGFMQWAGSEPGVGLPLGIGGLLLMGIAQFLVRPREQADLMTLPSFLLGISFVVLAVAHGGRADWNVYSCFGFAACVFLFGAGIGREEIVYVGLLLGLYGAWTEGTEARDLLHLRSSQIAGAFGIGAYSVGLAFLAVLSRVQRARRVKSTWATPAVRFAWVCAFLSLLLGLATGQVNETFGLIGALAAVVLMIAAVWEVRPPLAAAGSIVLIATAATGWMHFDAGASASPSRAFSPAVVAVALGCLAHLVTWRTKSADNWFFWARALYVGTLSFLLPLAVDAWLAIKGQDSQRILWDLIAASGVAVLGVGFLPSGLAWSMFAACMSSGIAVTLMTSLPERPVASLLVHATAGLAVLWIGVTVGMRVLRHRAEKTTHHGEAALAVFDFAAIFAGMICGLILIWRMADELMSRLINLHTVPVPIHAIGLIDLAVLVTLCLLSLWMTRSRALVTCLYWLMLLSGTWLSLMIHQYKEVRDPVTGIAQAVPTAWPTVLMLALASVIAAFVFAQGYVAYRTRVNAWPDRLEHLLHDVPSWPGFRLSVGAVSLVVFMLGIWQVASGWTVLAALSTGTCLLILAHRHWNSDLAEVAMGHITLSVCSAFLFVVGLFGVYEAEFAVRFPVMCNVVLFALVAMTFFWHWLARVWHQQLDEGQAWTTAGRLIPVAENFAFLVGALGLLVSMSMAFWPLTPNTPVPDNTTARWVFGMIANLLLLAVLAGNAIRTKRDTLAWLTTYSVLALFVFVSVRAPMNVYKEWLVRHWPFVLAGLVATGTAIGPAMAKTRLKPFVNPITLLTLGPLPLLALVGMFGISRMRDDEFVAIGTPAFLCLTCVISAYRSRAAGAVFLAAILGNLAWVEFWRSRGLVFGISDLRYLIPPGLTVFGLAYLYRRHQTLFVFHLTRSAGLVLVFGGLIARLFTDISSPHFLFFASGLTLLCALTLLAGFYLRAKPLLFFGGGFLLVELTALARYSYHSQMKAVWMVFWAILVVVVLSGAAWRVRRERLRIWWNALSRWDG